MRLESEKIEYIINNKEDELKLSSLVSKRIKEIISEGYFFCGATKYFKNGVTSFRLVYERMLERKVLTEKNKNISYKDFEDEIHRNISLHCSEKMFKERRQEQIEKMMSKSLYSNNLFDELISNRMFVKGIPAGHITTLIGKHD